MAAAADAEGVAQKGGEEMAFPITELPRDVLVASLGLLGALDLALAGTASRLFLLVAREVQRRPELIIEVGKPEEVLVALGRRLVSTPTMGFLFGTGNLSVPSIKQALAKRLPVGCQLVGASTPMLQALVPKTTRTEKEGVQTATELRHEGQEGQITLMLGSFPDAVARAFHISVELCKQLSQEESDASAATALKRKDLPTGDDWKTIVFMPIHMFGFNPVRVLKAYQKCCPNAAIIGGVAGEELLLHTLGKTQFMESGVVGLALKGEVPLTALVSRGCQPLSPPMLARGALVDEDEEGDRVLVIPELIAGAGTTIKPIEVAIKAQEQMDGRFGMFSGVRLGPDTGYVLDDLQQSSFVRGGGLRVSWECDDVSTEKVAAHCEVRMFQLSPAACRTDLRQLLGYVRAQCEERDEQVLGSVMFTCGGRTARFFSGEDCADAKGFQEAFPAVPLVGFWAGGEIGPQALAEASPGEATRTGSAAFQGFTAVFGIFRAPKPSGRTLLATLGDEQVPTEVGSALAQLALEAKERGNAAFRSEDVENAVVQYTRAADLAAVPSAAVAPCERAAIFSNRAAALMRTDAAAALSDAEAAIELDASSVKAHYRKALALVGLERKEEAAEFLRAAVGLFPEERALSDQLARVETDLAL